MPDTKQNPLEIAKDYKERLEAELSRLDEFLEMACRLSNPANSMHAELFADEKTETPLALH